MMVCLREESGSILALDSWNAVGSSPLDQYLMWGSLGLSFCILVYSINHVLIDLFISIVVSALLN